MICKKCKNKANIISYKDNLSLCSSCFTKYFEEKVKYTINHFNLFNKKDKVLVACSVSGEAPLLIKHKNKIKILTIKDTFNLFKHEKNIQVLSIDENFNTKFKKIKTAFRHDTTEIYSIQFTGGSIKTTKSHSLFVFEKDKITPKKVEDLKIGDYLVTFLSNNKKSNSTIVLNKEDYIKDSKRVFNQIPEKITLTPELMRLFGYYVAEGHITIKKHEKSRSWTLGFTFNILEKTQIKETIKFIQKYFNIKPKDIFHRRNSNSAYISYSNKEISQFFNNLFGHGAKTKHLPNFFFSLPKNHIIEFLRGYSGDSFTTKKEVGKGTISFKTRSQRLANELIFLLRLNTLPCTYTNEYDRGHFSPQKIWIAGGLNHLITIPSQHNPFFNKDFSHKAPSSECIRIPTQSLKEIYKKFPLKEISRNMYDRIRTNKTFNKKDCKILLEKLIKKKNLELTTKLKIENLLKLSSSDLAVAKVRKIKKEKFNGRVYDLSIPGSQAFFGGCAPVLLHNSGGKDSTALLYILKKLNYNIEAITVDALIGNYTKQNLKNLKSFCKKHKIKLHEISFRKEFGHSLCYLQSILKSKGFKHKSCTTCGVLRRYLLNKHSRNFKPAKIATGHNLDDEAQTFLMNLLKNNLSTLAKLGPAPGLIKDKKFIPRVKPLYFITEKEVTRYSKLKKFPVNYSPCPCASESYRRNIINLLKNMPEKAKINLIKNFLKILPKLKKQYTTNKKINYCENCQEPSKKTLCRTCEILSTLKIK